MAKNRWSNLPRELLSIISLQLGLIDLLGFRAVCKDWRSASSESSAHIESSRPVPWFLLYGEGPQCSLLTNKKQRSYVINLPQMDKATCLASQEGWLLLCSSSSLFFFCPFSKATIGLPNCPLIPEYSHSDFIVSFSTSPTREDCTVVAIKRESELKLQLYMLRRCEYEWTYHEYNCPVSHLGTIKGVAYHEGAFHFLDAFNGLLMFNTVTKEWSKYVTVPLRHLSESKKGNVLNYWIWKERFTWSSSEMMELLGKDDSYAISICGTMVTKNGANDHLIQHESYKDRSDTKCCTKSLLKGVWIQPRFYQISPYQIW